MSEGWVDDVSSGMSQDGKKMIRVALNDRHAAVFRDVEKQAAFLRLIDGLWRYREIAENEPALNRYADDFPKLKRGEKLRDRPSNLSRLIASQLATRYQSIFGKAPNAEANGVFPQILNIILGQMGLPELGRDAIQNVFLGKV